MSDKPVMSWVERLKAWFSSRRVSPPLPPPIPPLPEDAATQAAREIWNCPADIEMPSVRDMSNIIRKHYEQQIRND